MNVRNESGITLISLMVTIVVLIILASITIGTLSGDNGIIVSAENARNAAIDSGKLENDTLLSYENLIDSSINFNVIVDSGSGDNNVGNEDGGNEEEPEAHTHNYSILVNTTAPTCVAVGQETKKCTGCEETQSTTIAIDPNSHTGGTREECVYIDDTQHSRNIVCTGCSAVLSSKTEAHTNDGNGVCTDCGHDITSNHTHNYTVFVEQVSVATCVAQAQNKYACSVCGVTANRAEGEMLEHTWNDGVITTEPTTSAEGVRTYTCSICKGIKTETIAKLQYLSNIASIGDYVNYDPTSGGNVTEENTTYTSPVGTASSHGNGSAAQKFSASNYKTAGGKWRILDIDVNGTITLISDPIYEDSGTGMGNTGLTLYGSIGYLWAEEELHRISSIYGHGNGADTSQTISYYYGGPLDNDGSITSGVVEKQQGRKAIMDLDSGARAITADDIRLICGDASMWSQNYREKASAEKIKHKYCPSLSSTDTSHNMISWDIDYYYRLYGYKFSEIDLQDSIQEQKITILTNENEYWIASRNIETYSFVDIYKPYSVVYCAQIWGPSVGETYGKRLTGTYDTVSTDFNAVQEEYSSGVCVLVTLETGILTSDSVYNEDTGWNLEK